MVDIVRSDGVTAPQVYLNRGQVPDLLTAATTPIGGTTRFAYQPSTRYLGDGLDLHPLPDPIQVVSSVTVDDGNGNVGTTSFTYGDPWLDPTERQFHGFGHVSATRPDGRVVATTFCQGDPCDGSPLTQQVYAQQTLQAGMEYTYTPSTTAPFVTLPTRIDRLEYDGSATPRRSRTEFEYDGGGAITRGNPTRIVSWGEVSSSGADVDPSDTRTLELDYVPNDAIHLLDRVSARRLRAGAQPGVGNVVRESHFFYDDDTAGAALPVVGDLTQRVDVLDDPAHPDPTTTFGYDGYGNLTSVTSPRANAGEGGGTTSFEYDATYHTFPSAEVDALQHRSELAYVSASSCAITQPAGAGRVGTQSDPNDLAAGTAWQRCYDAFGRIVSEIGPQSLSKTLYTYGDTPPVSISRFDYPNPSGANARWHTYYFDGLGRPTYTYTSGPQSRTVVEARDYDASGRLTDEYAPIFDAAGQATTYAYDVLDRVTSIVRPGSGRIETFSYDRGLATFTDPNGNVKRRFFDPFGNVTRFEEVADSGTLVTTYDYDVADGLVGIVDQNGNQTQVVYDPLGRRTHLADPDIGYKDFTFDSDGNVLTEKVGGQETVTWAYDALDRPKVKSGISNRGWAPKTVTWSYDTATRGIGHLTNRSDDGTANDRYYSVLAYDLLGRPTSEKIQVGNGASARFLTFSTSYDGLGQLIQRTHPTGTQVGYTRDAAGYLTEIDAGGSPDASSITWAADGRLATWTAPGGVVTNRSYDPGTQRLNEIEVDSPSAGLLVRKDYIYDRGDRILGIIDGVVGSQSEGFQYDRLDRLTSASGPFGAAGAYATLYYAYDGVGNLTCQAATGSGCAGGTSLVYPVGNHQAYTIGGVGAAYFFGGNMTYWGSRRFYYNAFGELQQIQDSGSTTSAVLYDAEGQLARIYTASDGQTRHIVAPDFDWNATTSQASVHVLFDGERIATHGMAFTPPGPPPSCGAIAPAGFAPGGDPGDLLFLFAPGIAAVLLALGYDALRRRPAGQRGIAVISVTTGTAFLVVTSMPAPFGRLGAAEAQSGGATSIYYHVDHLGSVVAVTDPTGALVYTRSFYEPYGRQVGGGAPPTPFGFDGQRYGQGVYSMGPRWYDPAMGRFTQPDPIVADPFNPQSLNRYSFVLGDPVQLVDPTGLDPESGPSQADLQNQMNATLGEGGPAAQGDFEWTPINPFDWGSHSNHHNRDQREQQALANAYRVLSQLHQPTYNAPGRQSPTRLAIDYSLVALGRYHVDVTARNPMSVGGDAKFSAGPSDSTGGFFGRNLGGLLSAIGMNTMGVIRAQVIDVPRDFTDPGVALTTSAESPISYEKVVLEMRALEGDINRANIRYDILGPNSNSAAFSLLSRIGVTVEPSLPLPGYQLHVP